MIVWVTEISDNISRRLLDDLQGAGVTVSLKASDPSDVWLVVVTRASSRSVDWNRIRETDKPVINVILEFSELPEQPPGLIVDLSSNYVKGFRDLIGQLQTVMITRRLNPYPGFLAYGEPEAPVYYGRRAFTQKVREHIANGGRFIAVVGSSGSGKTSFIHAGLAARLRREAGSWLPMVVTLGDEPMRQLATRLQPYLPDDTHLTSRLYSNAAALGDALAEIAASHGKLLLALDSFENIFTRASLTDRVYFLDELYDATQRSSGEYLICVALRADFQSKLLEYPKWRSLLQTNTFTLPPLIVNELAEIIKTPAQKVGLTVDDSLAAHLVEDATRFGKSGSLLPLSLALRQLTAQGQMTDEQYKALGSLNTTVSLYAETTYKGMTAIQQNLARRILLQVIDVTEDGLTVLRPVERKRLAFTWASDSEVENTVSVLLGAQFLTGLVDAETGDLYLQLSHETLPQEWLRYKGWLIEDRETMRYGSHLEQLAASWNAREYAEEGLLRGAALDEAITWTQNPDHLPSPLLQNFVAVSSEVRRNFETQRTTQSVRQSRANVALILSFFVALLILIGGAVFLVQTTNERDTVATLQADTAKSLATATTLNQALRVTLNAAATAQSQAQMQIATSVAQYNEVSTAQAQAEADRATAVAGAEADKTTAVALAGTQQAESAATIDALGQQQAAAATALAGVQNLQMTLDASIKTQQSLTAYMAGQLAQTSNGLVSTQPELALRLAAEAGARAIAADAAGTNPAIEKSLQEALRANSLFSFGETIQHSWFLDDNNYAVIDYKEKPDELWQLNPPKIVAQFEHPVEQIIPVGAGKLFLVDYADEAQDELWRTEEHTVAAQLSGEVAPPPDPDANVNIPNVFPLDNDTYFVLKYSDDKPSELWEDATAKPVAALGGDIETFTPLADGYFFASYVDKSQPGGIWQISTRKMVQSADDVITTDFDNGIFALRRDRQYDEIWRTNPFAKVIQVIGRVDTVNNLTGSPYFIVQYVGDRAAEIWRDAPSVEKVYTFRGPIDTSTTFFDRQYFFIRYNDQSPSELWSIDPLQVAATLNGHLNTIFTILGQEEAVVDYQNNAISEVWSLKDHALMAQLHGNVRNAIPIMGDVFFAVQYEGQQPAEIWSAVDGKLIATLGDQHQFVKSITALKDGTYLVVDYESVPAELWQVAEAGATRLATLPDVATDIYPFANGDNFVVSYLNDPAQIWQTASAAPVLTFKAGVQQVAYNEDTKRLSFTTVDNASYVLNFDRFTQSAELHSEADLLAMVCQQLQENNPVSDDVLGTYLGGMPPIACTAD